MKKQIFTLAVSAAIAALTLGSCATINTGAALAEKGPIGQRIGESNSTIIMGLISLNAKDNNLQKAAENGGIKNVTQVEYIDDLILGGMLIKHTTRVYGE